METNGDEVQVEPFYDPSTHKSKVEQIKQLTTRLENAQIIRSASAATMISLYPVIRDAEALMEYFADLQTYGKYFGVVIHKSAVRELESLEKIVKTIREGAAREFRRNSRVRW